MIIVDTKQAIKGLKRLKSDLTEKQQKKAVALAFNDAIVYGRRQLADTVRQSYTVKLSGVNKATRIQRATLNRQFAQMTVKGKPLPLERFNVRQIKRGLSTQVVKGKRNIVRSAFFQKVKRKRAFARGGYKGKGFKFRNKRVTKIGNDLPINNLLGPSLPGMIGSKATDVEKTLAEKIVSKSQVKLTEYFNSIEEFYK